MKINNEFNENDYAIIEEDDEQLLFFSYDVNFIKGEDKMMEQIHEEDKK